MRKKSVAVSGSADKNHEKLIRSVVMLLESKGYMVRANYIDHPNGSPRSFNGYTPDIYALKDMEEILIEVETCKSLLSNNLLKWKRFCFNPRRRFWVIVPPTCREKAEMKKDVFNLPVEIYGDDLNFEFDKKIMLN